MPLDPTSILATGHQECSRHQTPTEDCGQDEDGLPDLPPLNSCVSNIVAYIGGWVARSTMKHLACDVCAAALITDEPPPDYTEHYAFIRLKNNGSLHLPSKGVHHILCLTERHWRVLSASSPRPCRLEKLLPRVLESLAGEDILNLREHAIETAYGIDNHATSLVRRLVAVFHKLRMHHAAKRHSLRLQRGSSRKTLNKLNLFRGH